MRNLWCVLVAVAVLAAGCETTPEHEAKLDQPPRYIFYKTKAVRLATPAWSDPTGARHRAANANIKLVYDDEVKCYAVENRERHYYDQLNGRFLRYWDNEWQTTPDYYERAHWAPAPVGFVSEPLQKRYENVPPGNPAKSKDKGR